MERASSSKLKLSYVFSIQRRPIEPDEFRADEWSSSVGSRISFHGIVRDHHLGQKVLSLEYSAYEEMCIKEGNKIIDEAADKFKVQAMRVVHRYGFIPIGECALWVEIDSAHRQEGFKAIEYLIDEIKTRLPIWKYETYGNGRSEWVYGAG